MVGKIGSPCGGIHVGSGLCVIVSTTIDIIKDTTEVKFLACIVGERCLDMIGTRVLRTIPVVGDIHERRFRVVEPEVLRIDKEHIERSGEHEIGGDGTLHEDAGHARGTHITQ